MCALFAIKNQNICMFIRMLKITRLSKSYWTDWNFGMEFCAASVIVYIHSNILLCSSNMIIIILFSTYYLKAKIKRNKAKNSKANKFLLHPNVFKFATYKRYIVCIYIFVLHSSIIFKTTIWLKDINHILYVWAHVSLYMCMKNMNNILW